MREHSEDPTTGELQERLPWKVLVYLNCKTQPPGVILVHLIWVLFQAQETMEADCWSVFEEIF